MRKEESNFYSHSFTFSYPIRVSSLYFNSTYYKFVLGKLPFYLTLLLVLANFHPLLRRPMILCFLAFIPRSGPSYSFAFNEPVVSSHAYNTRTHTPSRRQNAWHIDAWIAHIEPAHLVAGKFPAILRLLDRNNSSCPVKLLRFPRTTHDESNRNLEVSTIGCTTTFGNEQKGTKEKGWKKRTRVKFREIVLPYANRVKSGDT